MDQDTLLKRFIRYGGHTRLASKLAAAHFKDDQNAFYETLLQELGHFKGPLMKVGQLLSMVPDIVPEQYRSVLKELQAQAPPMGPLFVKRRMKGELGPDWENHFTEFNLFPASAASIGQVHKGYLKNNTPVACKLQYPNMKGILTSDLAQLKLILKLYQARSGALKTEGFYEETANHLHEEIDYLHEAQNLDTATKIFKDVPFVHVPKVHHTLSTKRLLTMSWEPGETLDTACHKSHADRSILSKRLFWAWYYPLYGYGFLHGDPHAGNFLFAQDNHITLMDFGCVRYFPKDFLDGTKLLYHTLKRGSDKTEEAYTLWGFQNLTPQLVEALNAWSKFLYGPLLETKAHVMGKTYNGTAGKELAHNVITELKKVGPVELPRPFILMHRAAIGMGAAFIQLNAEVHWQELFEELLARTALLHH